MRCACKLVCVCVRQHLTSGVFVHPENDITSSTGSEGPKKLCGFLCNHSVGEIHCFLHCMAIHAVGIMNISIPCTFSRIHAHMALRVLYFSAFICTCTCMCDAAQPTELLLLGHAFIRQEAGFQCKHHTYA